MNIISHEELKSLLHYNPETGVFNWINKYKSKVAGGIKGRGYLSIRINKVDYLAHRLAWYWMTGTYPKHDVDHKNRIITDNSWANLRASSKIGNCQNRGMQRNNTTGFKGVSFNKKSGKYTAYITVNKVHYRLGCFNHVYKAAVVADEARKAAFGEFYADIYN